MKDMFNAQVNSPETALTNNISAEATDLYVLNGDALPAPPNLLVLGGGSPNAETVKIVEKVADRLTVIRGFQGVAKSWNVGTVVSRNFTAYDHDAFKDNIETLNTRVNNKVEKDGNKVLSELDFTSEYKQKIEDNSSNIADVKQDLENHSLDFLKHRPVYVGEEEPENPVEGSLWLTPRPTTRTRILADWRMNEDNGLTVLDWSGNGYHGELVGDVKITESINEGSGFSVTGSGATPPDDLSEEELQEWEPGYIRTPFNALQGLNNFKVEVYCRRNKVEEGWVGLVNNYRLTTSIDYETKVERIEITGFHLSYNEYTEGPYTSWGVSVRMFTEDMETGGTDFNPLYTEYLLEVGPIYKIDFEYTGEQAILTIYKEIDGDFVEVHSASTPLTGLIKSGINPLNMLANNNKLVKEHSSFTLGRVKITTREEVDFN